MKIFVIPASRLNQVYPGFGDMLVEKIIPTENRCMLHGESIQGFYQNTEIPEVFKHVLNYFNISSAQRGYASVFVTKE